MTSYEQMKEEATSSDHGIRIISELEPALKDALDNTPPTAPFLEIGNREGGSAAAILYYLGQEGKARWFITVDSGDCPSRIIRLARETQTPHQHFRLPQADFVKETEDVWGFVFLDADHNEETVTQDMRKLRMVKGGILVVDDVHEWKELPSIEGLERVEYQGIDEGEQRGNYPHKHHVAYWRKL